MDLSWMASFAWVPPLVAGAGLSYWAGRAEANRNYSRDEAEAKKARGRDATEQAREAVFKLYVEARHQKDELGEKQRIKFESVAILDAEAKATLISNGELRELVRDAMGALRGLGAAVEFGRLKGDPVELQMNVLFQCLELMSAELRGDPLSERQVAFVREVGVGTRETWQALIASGGAVKS